MNNNPPSRQLITDKEYHRAAFSLSNRFYRLFWELAWLLLCRWTPNPLYEWRAFILRLFGAKIGLSNHIYPNCVIWSPKLLVTEDAVTIGPGAEIYNPGGIHLGHHTVISQYAFICGATHDYNTVEFTYIKKRIVIEPFVWISAHAIVLPGVVCHEGSILGAGGVASKSLEAWSIYAGNPAEFVKKRKKFTVKSGIDV